MALEEGDNHGKQKRRNTEVHRDTDCGQITYNQHVYSACPDYFCLPVKTLATQCGTMEKLFN